MNADMLPDDLFIPPILAADPNAFEAVQASIPRAESIRYFLALDLAEHVTTYLREHKKTRRWLARRLGKTDSELSKWLSGTHNLTLDSIAKLSDALGEDLLVSPRFPMGYFGSATSVAAKTVITTTDFDWSGGSMSAVTKPAKPKGQLPQLQTLPPRQVLTQLADAGLLQQLPAGDYSYGMAA